MADRGPKQHHYIPESYLARFAGPTGNIVLVDLWNGQKFPAAPKNVLKEKDLYTQPVHAEERLDNRLEPFFSTVEGKYPKFMAEIERRALLDEEIKDDLYQYILMLRTRVPNTLKAIVSLLSEYLLREPHAAEVHIPDDIIETLLKHAKQPLKNRPKTLKDALEAGLLVTPIDHHAALASVPHLVQSLAPFVARRGLLRFIHNRTDLDFITSDNPVIFYAKDADGGFLPYAQDEAGDFDFVMPLTPRIAIRSSMASRRGQLHKLEYSKQVVRSLNDTVALFSDRFIVGNDDNLIPYMTNNTKVGPVPEFLTSIVHGQGLVTKIGYKMGPPLRDLPKWEYPYKWE